MDYLEKINFNKNDLASCRAEFNSSLIEMLSLLNVMLEPDDINFKDLDEVLLYKEAETYSYGKILSYHYYDNYLINSDLTKKNIFELSVDCMNHDLKYMLNNYGLNEERILDHKILVKHLER